MKIALYILILSFLQIHVVYGNCNGKNCLDISIFPLPNNNYDTIVAFKNKFQFPDETYAWFGLTYPLIKKATSSSHHTYCRANLYHDIDLYPKSDRTYALVEYNALVKYDVDVTTNSLKKNVDMKIRFSFSDDILQQNQKYQDLINKSVVKKVEIVDKNPKNQIEVMRTWYEIQCENRPEAVDVYDSEQFDKNKKIMEMPIYGCIVDGKEIFALYDFSSESDDLNFQLSDLKAHIYPLADDWPLYENIPNTKRHLMNCSITPPKGTEHEYLIAKK
ncbi:MAG: hypothetical protein A2381_11000 [Bdellovibrionales bacterium RIFOXYB1_FULL_37_110]|nr:MAG: hypothetical protein A2181_07140 [Bdellovibrionales bacterium RIFOXYA1_FULL_38_20]OFZ51192.1 MAG: hypothetical protein A2417_17985 [Bdellovibrionales bacterium RIFOXYC1_FULL_37_79]OFZ61298.1 MAG: hypothetical protein A2381_11000 [Bdellovibrionales bacterium RIFOXYB1_FULL_37_110]OFZ62161.1 MAG: hypothetical protein A2577_14575 [Bdellovibrionales bacterium RIFOXYD1_FULL_36_51]